jgi:hypothetical protein
MCFFAAQLPCALRNSVHKERVRGNYGNLLAFRQVKSAPNAVIAKSPRLAATQQSYDFLRYRHRRYRNIIPLNDVINTILGVNGQCPTK